jgi:hypothetical protein
MILFLHLLSTNHKCTQPCYFPLLYKLATQKVQMDQNSLTRSSRLCVALVAIPVVFGAFRCSASQENHLVFRDIIFVINILYS